MKEIFPEAISGMKKEESVQKNQHSSTNTIAFSLEIVGSTTEVIRAAHVDFSKGVAVTSTTSL